MRLARMVQMEFKQIMHHLRGGLHRLELMRMRRRVVDAGDTVELPQIDRHDAIELAKLL